MTRARRAATVALLTGLGCGRIGYEPLLSVGGRDAGDAESVAALPDVDGSTLPDADGSTRGGSTGDDAPAPGPGASNDGSSADREASLDARATAADMPGVTPPPDAPPGVNYCEEIPALAAAPAIDGVLEPGLTLRDVTPARWNGTGTLPPGNTSAIAVGWRPDGLYLFARVWDPNRLTHGSDNTFCGDGVEVYFDNDGAYAAVGAYDDEGTRQFVMSAPEDDTNPVVDGWIYRKGASLGAWTSTRFRSYPLPGGYTVEAFVGAADLGLATWSLAAGGFVGMNFAHNVSVADRAPPTNCMRRIGQYFLRVRQPETGGKEDEPYLNPEAFCRPRLRAP